MQEDNVTGLQIRKEGEWVPVKPIPNALVVNVGDVIEILSNGKYKSIEHRAVTTETKARISYASFLFPHPDVEVEPFEHIVEALGSRRYKKVKYGDYLGNSLKGKLKGKAHIETAKIGMEPFDHMVESPGSLRMYKKVRYGDYLRQSLKRKMEGKAHTDAAKTAS
ncbi:unnamed protein product [Prunus armeniaca]|uniref:Fe2OG dioxygenase domain-containing protein n=1 Tax=Prunus armeniaca TaxID=36596 RepID=A0A6J5XRK8_PRUAR|nr:unnamed protein product [Prunus armeniaca]